MSNIDKSAIDTVIEVESLVETFEAAGLAPPAAGTKASEVLNKQLWPAFAKKLQDGWPADWPAYDASQVDEGMMGPWTANVAGTAPSCVVQQIMMDLGNWGLPADQNTVNAMASQITEEVAAHGGLTGTFYGHAQVGGSEVIYWGVAFGTGGITDSTGGTQTEVGIIYSFSAVLDVD